MSNWQSAIKKMMQQITLNHRTAVKRVPVNIIDAEFLVLLSQNNFNTVTTYETKYPNEQTIFLNVFLMLFK